VEQAVEDTMKEVELDPEYKSLLTYYASPADEQSGGQQPRLSILIFSM
jgi:hypothetical protein